MKQDLKLTLTVAASGGSSPYNYTLTNEWLWAPQGNNDSGGILSLANVLDRSNPVKTDYNFLTVAYDWKQRLGFAPVFDCRV